MISTCLALIGLLHPLVYIASAEGLHFRLSYRFRHFVSRGSTKSKLPRNVSGQYGPLQPPQCGYSNVSHAEVHSVVLAKRDAWPWAVILGYNNNNGIFPGLQWICAGTLISSRHVLTGGVCTLYRNLKVARIGALKVGGNDEDGVQPIDVEIEKIIVHPEFNSIGFQNDIAVLKLANEVSFSDRVRPICLQLTNTFESKNLSGSYAAGWGAFVDFLSDISGRIRFDQLMEVQVRVVSNEICRKAYSSFKRIVVDNRVLCVESINPEEQHCKGVSGSPLMLSQDSAFYEIGFMSQGSIGNDSPCIYTRVSAYMDFITSALK